MKRTFIAWLLNLFKILFWIAYIGGAITFIVFAIIFITPIANDFSFTIVILAISAIGAVVLLILLNIAMRIIGDYRARKHNRLILKIKETLNKIFKKGPKQRTFDPLKPYLNQVEAIETASGSFSEENNKEITHALREMKAGAQLQKQVLYSLSAWKRTNGLLLIGWLNDPQQIPLLNEAFYTKDPGISYPAAIALARYDSKATYLALIMALEEGFVERNYVAAVMETANYRDKINVLMEKAPHLNIEARYWAAYLLGRTKDRRVLPTLKKLSTDKDADVRAMVATAFSWIPDRQYTEVIIKLLKDPVWFVKVQAARTAGIFREPELIANLSQLMHDKHFWVRNAGAIGLMKYGKEAVPDLEKLLKDKDRFARNKAAELLGDAGVTQEKVLDLSKSEEIQHLAENYLVEIGRAEAISIIWQETLLAKPSVQLKLLDVIEKIDTPKFKPLLTELEKTASKDVSNRAKSINKQFNKRRAA